MVSKYRQFFLITLVVRSKSHSRVYKLSKSFCNLHVFSTILVQVFFLWYIHRYLGCLQTIFAYKIYLNLILDKYQNIKIVNKLCKQFANLPAFSTILARVFLFSTFIVIRMVFTSVSGKFSISRWGILWKGTLTEKISENSKHSKLISKE